MSVSFGIKIDAAASIAGTMILLLVVSGGMAEAADNAGGKASVSVPVASVSGSSTGQVAKPVVPSVSPVLKNAPMADRNVTKGGARPSWMSWFGAKKGTGKDSASSAAVEKNRPVDPVPLQKAKKKSFMASLFGRGSSSSSTGESTQVTSKVVSVVPSAPVQPKPQPAVTSSSVGSSTGMTLVLTGDSEILDQLTIRQLWDAYVDEGSPVVNQLLRLTNEPPMTRNQRIAAAPAKVAKLLERTGRTLKAEGEVSKAASAVTLADLLKEEVKRSASEKKQVISLIVTCEAVLIDWGYSLARLYPEFDPARNVVSVRVDKGRIHQVRLLKFKAEKDVKKLAPTDDYKGRYFSRRQMLEKIDDISSGKTFDYREMRRTLYAISSHPDLRMDLTIDRAEEPDQRLVDLYLYVEERLPLHVILSVGNSGTDATGSWRPSMTLQYLNLTRHDDVLTANIGPLSENLNDMQSFGANYYLPYYAKNGGGVSLYGGYSDLDAKELVENITVRGQGWFVGAQEMHRVWSTSRHVFSLGLGLTYRYIEDRLILTEDDAEDYPLQKRPLTLVPLSLIGSYSSLGPDVLGGRNYMTLQCVKHFGALMGASDDSDFEAFRADADSDYLVTRLQLARLQPLFGKTTTTDNGIGLVRTREWVAFLKGEIQWADGPLLPVEQKAVGGMDTVRGFPERIVQGDFGASGSLEFRSPLVLSSYFNRLWTRNKKSPDSEGFQFIPVFADAGWVEMDDSFSDPDSFTIASVGTGIRLMMGQSFLFRFDWGFPVVGRDDVNEVSDEKVAAGGRYHLSAQFQF